MLLLPLNSKQRLKIFTNTILNKFLTNLTLNHDNVTSTNNACFL